MKNVTITKAHNPMLYDSANGKSLKAEKVVDVTAECGDRERTLMLFTRAERGPIVQICHPYDGEAYMGAMTHFFIEELARPIDERDDTFALMARRAGMSRPEFVKLVKTAAA